MGGGAEVQPIPHLPSQDPPQREPVTVKSMLLKIQICSHFTQIQVVKTTLGREKCEFLHISNPMRQNKQTLIDWHDYKDSSAM